MKEMKEIHGQLTRLSPHLSPSHLTFLNSRLLFFAATSNSGSLIYAQRIFRLIQNPNLFMYNAIIRAYACDIQNHISFHSLFLYKRMRYQNITPDSITINFLLKDCVKRTHNISGELIHSHVVKFGLCRDVYVQNGLIRFYAECGGIFYALKLFDDMPNRDIVSCNTIIIGCLREGEVDLALDLFMKMEEKNVITWNSIITGFVQGGRPKEALILFDEMKELADHGGGLYNSVVHPDKITVACVLSACASVGAISHGESVHGYLKRSCLECDVVIGTALLDMYGKCGCIEKAMEIFKWMPIKDVLAWTAMISAYALHGYGEEAFETFREMVQTEIRPNAVTFVALLTACSHSGMVDQGRFCFDAMKYVYGIQPKVQHYACLIDILGRACLFEEAERVIRSMPMEPDVYVWGALLGCCQMHGNVELGEKVAKCLINLEPLNHAFYVNLCDVYAKAGKLDSFKIVRSMMKDKGIKKLVPGCSMTEIDGVIHEFSVKGSPGVQMEDILNVITSLSYEMKFNGTHFSESLVQG
ncbi:hypothetical protein LIER_35091 [Lithospermum erythrorhizon]|uniref:Pentatricopeptide repeat-containing protein n=1 Tax=Lithospermum erythrorhizon TaxID=34254 RepID=A0AAV3NMX8_LITER